MTREILMISGISSEIKKRLQADAKRLYGKENASLLMRQLIAEHMNKTNQPGAPLPASDTDAKMVRVELRMFPAVDAEIRKRADACLSDRNYYLNSIIMAHLGQPQLQGDEIGILRRSNYELAKIGTNLNQIAKKFNEIIAMRGGEKMPEVGKKIASLRREISEHTGKVLRVLTAGTAAWESTTKGRGQLAEVRRKKTDKRKSLDEKIAKK